MGVCISRPHGSRPRVSRFILPVRRKLYIDWQFEKQEKEPPATCQYEENLQLIHEIMNRRVHNGQFVAQVREAIALTQSSRTLRSRFVDFVVMSLVPAKPTWYHEPIYWAEFQARVETVPASLQEMHHWISIPFITTNVNTHLAESTTLVAGYEYKICVPDQPALDIVLLKASKELYLSKLLETGLLLELCILVVASLFSDNAFEVASLLK